MSYDTLVERAEASGDVPPGGMAVIFGGIHMLRYDVPKDTVLISHCHVYDHPSILAAGTVELWTADGGLQTLIGPTEVKIAAGVKHALTAITDVVWYCIHSQEPQVLDQRSA